MARATSNQAAAWMVRAGREQRLFDRFIDRAQICVGFGNNLSEDVISMSREELKLAYLEVYPNVSTGRLNNRIGQLHRFLSTFEIGDRVVTYDASLRRYIVGKITSTVTLEHEEDEEPLWVRSVEWTHKVSRDQLTASERNQLGSTLTIFKLKQPLIEHIDELAVGIDDQLDVSPTLAIEHAHDETAPITADDLADQAREHIEDRLVALDWEQMQELAAGLLRGMGYMTRVADPGPDRGIDVFASPDGLGLEEPRIFVEVKHRPHTTMGAPAVRAFLGGRRQGDRCVYISTGGFTREARYEAERATIPTHLVDLRELTRLLLAYYANLDERTKALIPLRMVYWPVD